MAYLDKAGVTYLWNKIKSMFAKKKNGVYYVEGTNTATSVWTGTCADITEYYDGLVIAFKVSVTGASSTDTTLNINNLGAKNVVRNASTQVTTNYPANSVVIMTYTTDDGVGYWKIADYDANSYAYVRQYYTTTSANYPLLFKYDSGTSTTTSYVTKYSRYGNKIYANPSTGTVTATTFSGALSGNATSATKATQDGNGKTISSTYVSSMSVSGSTLTYNKGDGTSSSITLPSSGGGGSLEPTGVTAGTYGTYSSGSYYYIPNIAVDEYGRITSATQNYLGFADAKSSGLINNTMYSFIANNSHLGTVSGTTTADKDNYKTITTGNNADCISISVFDSSTSSYNYVYYPKVYGVYFIAYVDSSKTTQAVIPVKDYYAIYNVSSKGNYATVYFKFPSEFYEFNSGLSLRYFVMYEATMSGSSSSSSM